MIATDDVDLKTLRKEMDLSQFRPDLRKSLFYLLMDVLLLTLTLYTIYELTSNGYYILSFLLALLAGNIFFSLFVLGHDCGHGSFSRNKTINNIVGFVLHHFLLTPYWGWKKSHQKHHRYPGNIENDESFVPFTEHEAGSLLGVSKNNKASFFKVRLFNSVTFFTGINFHIYTVYNPRTKCSHFLPNKVFLKGSDDKWIYFGTAFSIVFLGFLLYLTIESPVVMFFVYWLPFMVCYHIMSFVTLMQHHHETDSRWYYSQDWSQVKGAFNTFDYRYGALNFLVSKLHHNIANFHLIHHLFSAIPHYNLEAATKYFVEQAEVKYEPKQFFYVRYFKIIWLCNFVDNKKAGQKVYPLRSFEEL